MKESDVLIKTHQFFKSQSLGRNRAIRLYTDVHASLLPHKVLKPFQRFTLDMGDFVLHPDIVGQLDDGETVFAIEGKGSDDLLKGLAQAEMYQVGFHQTFLAADAGSWGSRLIDYAKGKNVGVIAVDAKVEVVYCPEARMPFRDAFRFVARQMESVIHTQAQTFQYNVPTHYLAWVIALKPDAILSMETIRRELAEYPMPSDWKGALRGAQKLGLVNIDGREIRITEVGKAVKDLLPSNLEVWSGIHEQLKSKKDSRALVECHPQAAAVLRLLLLQDPMVRLAVEGLKSFSGGCANFAELATRCDEIDHASAPVFFLKPESVPELSDKMARIRWRDVKGEHYRSRTFYQYKSILKHAGILQDTRLGGATTRNYNPTADRWKLM